MAFGFDPTYGATSMIDPQSLGAGATWGLMPGSLSGVVADYANRQGYGLPGGQPWNQWGAGGISGISGTQPGQELTIGNATTWPAWNPWIGGGMGNVSPGTPPPPRDMSQPGGSFGVAPGAAGSGQWGTPGAPGYVGWQPGPGNFPTPQDWRSGGLGSQIGGAVPTAQPPGQRPPYSASYLGIEF